MRNCIIIVSVLFTLFLSIMSVKDTCRRADEQYVPQYNTYQQIQENNSDIESIGKWIDEIRIELKKKVALKQHKMIRNQNFYTYMHNIFGAEVINIFDMKYHVEQVKKPQLKEEKTTEK